MWFGQLLFTSQVNYYTRFDAPSFQQHFSNFVWNPCSNPILGNTIVAFLHVEFGSKFPSFAEGEIIPNVDRELMWAVAKQTTIPPGEAILLTTSPS